MLAVLDGDDQQVLVHTAVLIKGGQAGGTLPLGIADVAVQGLAVGVVLAVSNAALDSILDDVHSIVRLRGVLVVAAAVQLVVLLVEFLNLFIGVGSIKRGGDHHAVDSVTAQVGQLGRVVALADAGQVDAVLLHLAADHSDLGVIAPEDNKVRIGLLDLAQGHGEVGVAGVVDFAVYHFQAEVIADGAGNLETTSAEVGGLVQDGESLGVVFIDHVAHDVAHMQLIGSGQLVDVVVAALGDSNVGGSRGDLGNLGGLGDLHVGQGAGRSLRADNGVDLVLLHQLLHGGHGGGRHTFIIDGNEVDGDGAIDAASILKPVLARGELQLIGATTDQEFRTHIQKDAALERRFGRVQIEEPTPAQAAAILEGLAPRYERYHSVHLPPETLREAVELSVRYLPGRFLPDKAIDLVDEACAAARIRAEREGKADPTLTREDIARVVAQASGVPVERVGEKERERLDKLESRLNAEIVGQQKAVAAVAGAIRRSRTGLGEPGRPMGAMLFLGPTGVGKTALAKALAASWFGSEKALLKFDMSEYQEQHTTARLLGAPPGYLGHDEGGQLTEAVRRRPYSVVLFDEIEKAHPDIQNILLQILEDGQLTDAMGRKADFRNTIVLLTSNLGARFLAGQSAPLGFAAGSEAVFEKQSAQAIEEAKKWFRPELVGRLDELIVFRPLAEDSLCAIAEKLLGQLEARAARNGYQLTHTPRVGAVLAARARSPYGARELRRQVDRAVEQALANQIASGTAHTGQHWTADCTVDGAIVLEEGEAVEQTIG